MYKKPQRMNAVVIVLLMAVMFTTTLATRAKATERYVNPKWIDKALIPDSLSPGATAFGSVTAAIAMAKPGDHIVLGPGKYEEPNEKFPIIVDKEIAICSAESIADVVISGSAQKPVFEIKAENVEIRGLTIEFKRSGIVVLADKAHIVGNQLRLAAQGYLQTSCGVWLAGVCDVQVYNNEFIDCGIAMAGPPISESSKDLPVLTGLFEVGENSDFFTTHKIENNVVNGKPINYLVNKSGISLEGDAGQIILACCSDISINDMEISRTSMGIEIAYCNRIKISDTTVSNCGLFGVYLCYSDYCEILRTTCSEDTHGIDIRASKWNQATDCSTINCGQGLFVSWASNNLFENCVMKGNGVGVFVAVGEGNHISNCRIAQNEIGVNAKNEKRLLLTEAIISSNTTTGVRLLNTACSFHRSRFEDNWVGLIGIDCSDIMVLNCEFNKNANCGLYLFNVGSSRIAKNEFSNNMEIDFEAAGFLTNTVVTNNSFSPSKRIVLNDLVSTQGTIIDI